MAASSLSVAAAMGTCSHSLSSARLDNRLLPLQFLSCKRTPILTITHSKLKFYLIYPTLSRSSMHCVSTSTFDSSVELNEKDESETEETVPEEEMEEDNAVSLSVEAGRLYVGNLPFSLTSSQLSEIFEEAGGVVSVEIVYDRRTDRSRGFAFVTMSSAEEANEAIRLFNGAQIGGRSVKVNFPEVPKGGEREVMAPKIRSNYQGFVDSPYKLYAGNLSWNLTSQNLRETFADQPGFLSAKIIFDRDSGRSRGFGFITFSSAEDAESALNAMNGMEMEGRLLRLNLAEQKSPESSPPSAVENTSESDLENIDMLSSVST